MPALAVEIVAKLDKFEAGMRDMQSRAQAVASTIKGVFSAAILRQFVVGVRESLQAIDDMSDAAARLNLGVEAFQNLAYAAQSAGSSQEALTTSINKMLDNLESSPSVFESLGLDAGSLQGKSSEAIFAAVAEQISKIETQSGKVAAAMNVFGKSGAELLNLMEGGARGVEEAMAKAAELGGTLTQAQVNMAKEANQAWDDMQRAIAGVANTLVVNLAPAITTVADNFQWFWKDLQKGIEDMITMGILAASLSSEDRGKLADAVDEAGRDVTLGGKRRARPAPPSAPSITDTVAEILAKKPTATANAGLDAAEMARLNNAIIEAGFSLPRLGGRSAIGVGPDGMIGAGGALLSGSGAEFSALRLARESGMRPTKKDPTLDEQKKQTDLLDSMNRKLDELIFIG